MGWQSWECGMSAKQAKQLVHSKMEKEHLEMLNNAFECSCIADLKIKLSKCSF